MRLVFETDARDDYFRRRIERGNFSLVYLDKSGKEQICSYVGPNLKNGIASVTASLPEGSDVGDLLVFISRCWDARDSFENRIEIIVKSPADAQSGGHGERKPPHPKPGQEREVPQQLSMPHIERIYRDQWEEQKPAFDEFTAMRVEVTGYEGPEEKEIYEFKVNMDNTPLLNEIKQRRLEDVPARNQFLYANVLIGLSLLLQDRQITSINKSSEYKIMPIENRIEMTCKALAPFMLALTSLGHDDLSQIEEIDGLEAASG